MGEYADVIRIIVGIQIKSVPGLMLAKLGLGGICRSHKVTIRLQPRYVGYSWVDASKLGLNGGICGGL